MNLKKYESKGHIYTHTKKFHSLVNSSLIFNSNKGQSFHDGFFLLLRNYLFMRVVKILFLSFTCEDIKVVMVTNMISQLQESFPLSRAAENV